MVFTDMAALQRPGALPLLPFMLLMAFSVLCMADSDPVEVAALRAIRRNLGDVFNRLSNWEGDDPCGSQWTGVICSAVNGRQHVQELRLLNMNFTGTLASDFGNLTGLIVLNVMWNNITGSIPSEIGLLSKLYLLLLSGNKLTGTIPPELGNLSQLNRLQLDSNNLSGPVPASLQYLNQAQHFHLNNNSLRGSIPSQLGQLESLLHLLLDNNDLSGELPPELSNISTLIILQLDNNHFHGSIPLNYSKMRDLKKLSLRNCNLSGTIPDLLEVDTLEYLDLSHNNLIGSLPSGNQSQHMTTIDLSFNNFDGEVPSVYYQLLQLELLSVRNNSLNGTVLGGQLVHNEFTSADSKLILDFQYNNFTGFTLGLASSVGNITFRLYGNPVCSHQPWVSTYSCVDQTTSVTYFANNSASKPLSIQCSVDTCDGSHNQEVVYGLMALGQCHCAYPLIVGYRLKSPSFINFPPYEEGLLQHFSSGLNLAEYQVNMSDFKWEPGPRLSMTVKLFPNNATSQFSRLEVLTLYDIFATWKFHSNDTFGPYELISFTIGYPYNEYFPSGSTNKLSGGAIAGMVIGAVTLAAVIVVIVGLFIRKRQHPHPSLLKPAQSQYERIKVAGVKIFTYDEISKATDHFGSSMEIGQGGYGKVYKAILEDGSVVAIKRAQEGSLQGSKEFYTEIELLSRVHHRNLVSLIGYCDDEGEQILVYEFMANGTLRDHLSSSSKVPLDFSTRLQIALGSAKGILYLHTEANPPIYHRDIKATNILLDEKRKAKVADFGLSKLAPAPELEGDAGGFVSTVVKGTPGYLDPEYFLTHKLTDKSDVYSFGVVLLELLTGKQPIFHGKNLAREVSLAYDAGMILSLVDDRMGSYPSECLEPLVRLGLSCCTDDPECRPSIAQVTRELEAIWNLMPSRAGKASFEFAERPSTKQSYTHDIYGGSSASGSELFSKTVPTIAPR